MLNAFVRHIAAQTCNGFEHGRMKRCLCSQGPSMGAQVVDIKAIASAFAYNNSIETHH